MLDEVQGLKESNDNLLLKLGIEPMRVDEDGDEIPEVFQKQALIFKGVWHYSRFPLGFKTGLQIFLRPANAGRRRRRRNSRGIPKTGPDFQGRVVFFSVSSMF